MGKNKKKHRSVVSTEIAATSGLKSSWCASEVLLQSNRKLLQKHTETDGKKSEEKRDMESCLLAFCLARDHNKPKYHAKMQRYIIKNFDDAIREPKFYDDLTKDDIVVFLQSNDLVVSCEEVVYHMVIRWVKHKLSARSKYLDELLELVRFPQLELDFLGQQVVRESIVLDSSVGQLLLHEAFEYHQSKLAKQKEL